MSQPAPKRPVQVTANDNWVEVVAPPHVCLRAILFLMAAAWVIVLGMVFLAPGPLAIWLVGSLIAGPIAAAVNPRWRREWGRTYAVICLAWPISLPMAVMAFVAHRRRHGLWRDRNASELANRIVSRQ